MANKVANFANSKTVREYLSDKLEDDKVLYINSAGFGESPKYQPVYNVDVIWDGGSYYLSYTDSEEDSVVHITHLDMVLPAKIV